MIRSTLRVILFALILVLVGEGTWSQSDSGEDGSVKISIIATRVGMVLDESKESSANYDVKISGKPGGTVILTMITDGQTEVSPKTIQFTKENHRSPRFVTITAVNDGKEESNPHTGTVIFQARLEADSRVLSTRSVEVQIADKYGKPGKIVERERLRKRRKGHGRRARMRLRRKGDSADRGRENRHTRNRHTRNRRGDTRSENKFTGYVSRDRNGSRGRARFRGKRRTYKKDYPMRYRGRRGPDITRTGAFVRSALLPGLGQHYQGRDNAGHLYMGAFATLGLTAIGHFSDYAKKKKIYEAQRTQFLFQSSVLAGPLGLSVADGTGGLLTRWQNFNNLRKERTKMDAAANQGRTVLGVLGALYAWNLLDVALFHPSEKTSARMTSRGDGLNLTFVTRF